MKSSPFFSKSLKDHLGIFLLIISLTSCGTYQAVTYSNDGVYGASSKVATSAEKGVTPRSAENSNYNENYFSQKAKQYQGSINNNGVLSEVESYSNNNYDESIENPAVGNNVERSNWEGNYAAQGNTAVFVNSGWGWGYNNYYPFWNRGFRNGYGYCGPFYSSNYYGNPYGFYNNFFYGNRFNNYYGHSIYYGNSTRFNSRAIRNNNSPRNYTRGNTTTRSARTVNGRRYTPRQSTTSRSARSVSPQTTQRSSSRTYTPRSSSSTSSRVQTPSSRSSRTYTPSTSRGTSSRGRSTSSGRSYRRR